MDNVFGNDAIVRGQYGYIDFRKTNMLLKTIMMAVVIAAIVGLGYLIFHKVKNYLMIPAMLLVIPFANFLVIFASFLKFHTGDPKKHGDLMEFENAGLLLCDLVVVDEKGKRLGCDFIVTGAQWIYAYSSCHDFRTEQAEIPLNDKLKGRGLVPRVRCIQDWDAFLEAVNGIQTPDEAELKLIRETILGCCL